MYRASGPFSEESLVLLNELNSSYFAAPTIPQPLQKGLKLNADIFIDTVQQRLSFPVDPDGNPIAPPIPTGGESQNLVVADGVVWFPIGKPFGPASFERIGVTYKESAVALLLDASLGEGSLNLSLLGLKATVSLESFEPRFELQGLGIAYNKPPIEIGGSFVKGLTQIDGKTYTSYSGSAFIKNKALTIPALGSYILAEEPSLLIYALMDRPIGGPSFFFVTGLAAGFGYNRRLNPPPLYRLPEFPLISAALNPSTSSSDVALELRKLAPYIPPAQGEYFLAVGVKFTSFKLMESFALLIVSFGESLRIDVLGTSRVIFPSKAPGQEDLPEIARVEIAFQAVFAPDEGYLGVQGQLTPNSFLFSRDCILAGGFAFYSWFTGPNAGDFVQTLGGYHPSFKVPLHYPQVPRLTFNWNVDNKTSIKGSLYYALTGRAVMAGGHLEAAYEAGNFRAWFRLGVDFLIAWKPFAYEARARVNIGASYTFKVFGIRNTVSVDVGADLHIWGPEFGGRATVYILFFSFDVEFGDRTRSLPKPIDWNEFKGSFLPADSEICGITVKDGLVAKEKGANSRDLGVLNAKDIALVTNSVIPAQQGQKGQAKVPVHSSKFGVAPMGKKASQVTEAQHIVETTILAQDVVAKRQSLLESIGIDDPFVELKPAVESRFIFAPQIEKRK